MRCRRDHVPLPLLTERTSSKTRSTYYHDLSKIHEALRLDAGSGGVKIRRPQAACLQWLCWRTVRLEVMRQRLKYNKVVVHVSFCCGRPRAVAKLLEFKMLRDTIVIRVSSVQNYINPSYLPLLFPLHHTSLPSFSKNDQRFPLCGAVCFLSAFLETTTGVKLSKNRSLLSHGVDCSLVVRA
jgi:hypothetical protein